MRNIALAEWLLTRYTTEACAASIIGDLMEDRHGRGSIGFWRSLLTILWSFVWRRALAFAVALVFGLISFDFLHNLMYGVHAAYLPSGEWRILLDFICLTSILLSFGMAYTAVRYGMKDTFAQQVIALWGLTSTLSAYWWMPVILVAVTILGMSFLLFSFFSAPRRQALLASVVAISFAVAVYWLASFFMQNLAGSHVPLFNNMAFYAFTLGLALQPTVYSRVHTIFWPGMRTCASQS
jgi:hypothetical protein